MGLAQKRIIQEFKDTKFNDWKAKFDAACGCSIPMEVNWDSMQAEDYNNRDNYFTWYEAVYFRPLMTVFTALCADNMGKEAVKSSVKKITIDGTEGSHPKASAFKDGVFTLKHKFNTNVSDEKDRVKAWQKMIEDQL